MAIQHQAQSTTQHPTGHPTGCPTGCPAVEYPDLAADDAGLLRAVIAGHARLTPYQAMDIFNAMPTPSLGRWADARCKQIHGDSLRTYILDRNINYTNVCNAKCTFCAFKRNVGDHDAYTLEYEEIYEKIAELSAIGGTQILMQGGMNPELPLDWYLDLLAGIKDKFPHIHIHAFSSPELIEFVQFFNPPGATLEDKIRWVLVKLQAAGLDTLPGGGGEIFSHPVRRKIGLGKCDAEAWFTCMYVAHTLGMFTSASMMFGHIEGYADRIHHMLLVRQWQDRALRETGERDTPMGHYKSFIAWPFQRENTPLGNVPDWGESPDDTGEFPGDIVAREHDFGRVDDVDYRALGVPTFGRRVRRSGSTDYLRTQAISRLFLDNIYSIGSSWVTMGPHIGQVGLAFGANDMGSIMMEENVVSSAGTTYCLDEAVLCRLIRDAGFTPAQRDNSYDILRIHDSADTSSSPDLAVTDWATHRVQSLHVHAASTTGGSAELTVSAKE